MKNLNIQLLLTGNELMTGDVIDSNSAMIAQHLLSIGLKVHRKVTVSDELTVLTEEIKHISEQADILIINGGLGPTIDDLTAQALALSSNRPLKEHDKAVEHLTTWCRHKGIPLDKTNLKQALLPENVNIIKNKVGSAVGFHIKHKQCDIYCTPGVPSELEVMLNEELIPEFQNNISTMDYYKVSRLHVFGIGESKLQQMLNKHFVPWPNEIKLGFRAASPFLELKLTINHLQHEEKLKKYKKKLHDLLGAHILSELSAQVPNMADYVLDLLKSVNKKITLAESCTGGLIASLLTNISGSSESFEAGFVTYSNEMKSKMISVSPQVLIDNGAVSEKVVVEMALGALEKSGADYVIAVSGIAGPNGGSEEKPVGTVWVAWGEKGNIKVSCMLIKGSRDYFQKSVANRALDLIRRELLNLEEYPNYLQNEVVKKL